MGGSSPPSRAQLETSPHRRRGKRNSDPFRSPRNNLNEIGFSSSTSYETDESNDKLDHHESRIQRILLNIIIWSKVKHLKLTQFTILFVIFLMIGGFITRRNMASTTGGLMHLRGMNVVRNELIESLYDDLPFIHIVNSRFMQEQSHLLHLTKARIELFETFCLPTMLSQTIQPDSAWDPKQTSNDEKNGGYKFLWIIKTDPNLDPASISRMVELLRPHRNFYLVGSNTNYGVGTLSGSWRDGESGTDVLNSQIYTGDKWLLEKAQASRKDKIVIETRLDADDGLQSDFLENVQEHAIHDLNEQKELPEQQQNDKPRDKPTWKFWCIAGGVEWYPTTSQFGKGKHKSKISADSDPGRLHLNVHPPKVVCLTPGLTIGLAVGETATSVPHYSHYDLLHNLGKIPRTPEEDDHVSCGLKQKWDCADLLHMIAVRSRTPTSAGMKNLSMEDFQRSDDDLVDEQWVHMEEKFALSRNRAAITNQYLADNFLPIMEDNLKGQCTHGHSCKHKTKVLLKEMMDAIKHKSRSDSDSPS